MDEKPYNRPRILRGRGGRAYQFRFFPPLSATSVVKTQQEANRPRKTSKNRLLRLHGRPAAVPLPSGRPEGQPGRHRRDEQRRLIRPNPLPCLRTAGCAILRTRPHGMVKVNS